MTVFIIRRLAQSLIVLLLTAVIVFLGVFAIGDPAEILIAADATPAERAQVEASLGLDKPMHEQFLKFLGNAAQGDLGTSFVFNQPSISLIMARLPATLPAPGAGAAGPGGRVDLPALKSLVVTGDLDPQLAVEIVGEAADEPAARSLADVVRGLVALMTLQAGQKPELKELASAVSVASEASRVRVSARIPHELLEALQPKRAEPASPVPAKP